MKILIIKEEVPTMAGPVTYYTAPCPYGQQGICQKTANVGSSDCQMCSYFGEIEDDKVICKHP